MKKFISYFVMMLLLSFTIGTSALLAQEEEEDIESEYYEDDEEVYELDILEFWQEKYNLELKNIMFEDVVDAIIEAIYEINACAVIPSSPKVNDEGFQKQVIKSDYCIFAMGDTTYKSMEQYSVLTNKETIGHKCLPFIPGSRWKNGRVSFKFVVKEIDDETITILLKNAEISGKDEKVTNKVHFWESNGIFETNIMARIKEIAEGK